MIIDSLTHILPEDFISNREKFLKKDLTFRCLFSDPKAKIVTHSELLKSMSESGISKSIIGGFGWTDFDLAKLSNNYNLEISKKSNGNLIPLCSVNPLWGKQAIDEIRRCFELGAKGIGELHPNTQGFSDFDNNLDEIMYFASSYKMPIIFHSSEPIGHKYPGKGTMVPEKLIKLIKNYQNNIFIFSHFGGGLPFYSVMPEIKKLFKNVYFDSDAFHFLYDPNVFKVTSIASGYEKILFATDFPITTQYFALKKFNEVTLNMNEKKSILALNADKIYSEVKN